MLFFFYFHGDKTNDSMLVTIVKSIKEDRKKTCKLMYIY